MWLVTLVVGCGQAVGPGIIHFPNRERPWDKIPTITISAQEGDPRIQLAEEAVNFWNKQLAAIGTAFRLGRVTRTTETLPSGFLSNLSAAVLDRHSLPKFPESVRRMEGDLIIIMSDGDFVSFSTGFRPGGKVVVGIRSDQQYPLTLPNVARNVIAHEMGHAIGLGHNNDPTKLMCGRPAPCRPDAFRSSEEIISPLTEEEKSFLLRIYPPTCQPSR